MKTLIEYFDYKIFGNKYLDLSHAYGGSPIPFTSMQIAAMIIMAVSMLAFVYVYLNKPNHLKASLSLCSIAAVILAFSEAKAYRQTSHIFFTYDVMREMDLNYEKALKAKETSQSEAEFYSNFNGSFKGKSVTFEIKDRQEKKSRVSFVANDIEPNFSNLDPKFKSWLKEVIIEGGQ